MASVGIIVHWYCFFLSLEDLTHYGEWGSSGAFIISFLIGTPLLFLTIILGFKSRSPTKKLTVIKFTSIGLFALISVCYYITYVININQ